MRLFTVARSTVTADAGNERLYMYCAQCTLSCVINGHNKAYYIITQLAMQLTAVLQANQQTSEWELMVEIWREPP